MVAPMAHSTVEITAVDQVRVRLLPDGRMTREDAARYVGLAPKTPNLELRVKPRAP